MRIDAFEHEILMDKTLIAKTVFSHSKSIEINPAVTVTPGYWIFGIDENGKAFILPAPPPRLRGGGSDGR